MTASVVTLYLMAECLPIRHDAQRYAGALPSWQGQRMIALGSYIARRPAFSDGPPLTADDVVLSLRAPIRPHGLPIFATAMTIGGRPIEAAVVMPPPGLIFPEPVAAPENYLRTWPCLPRHILEEISTRHFKDAYAITSEAPRIVVAGAFWLTRHARRAHCLKAQSELREEAQGAWASLP